MPTDRMGSGTAVPATPIVITSALPYANGDIHLGHLVEVVQTDIFVRFNRMLGREVLYVCADDTHGTPIEFAALRRGITCEELIAESWKKHTADYAGFGISFDIFYTTNSPENQRYANLIYQGLRDSGLVVEREIEQYYCDHDKRFLPDRFIVGACPKCGTADQYGDVCESCGATYAPTDLAQPRCVICRNSPVLRKSTHLFVELAKREQFLREFLGGTVLQDDMKNFVMRWIDEGLREWCISRDGPYFGFPIPGTTDKFFYVWLDAPIGYLSSSDKWCADNGKEVSGYWSPTAPGEVVHFIGKDIVYFHTLFWPVMLSAAGFKVPDKVFVHGFLTVEGEKMSKTRGTFILAREFLDKMKHPLASQYLRFYYGAKLGNTAGDIDLNTEEFCNRVNTTLVNNIGNLHHRTCVFIDRYCGSRIPDAPWDEGIAAEAAKAGEEIAAHFRNVEFRAAVEKIHALGSLGNRYYQDTKPWELVKTDPDKAAAVMVTCINLVKALAVYLKPIVPELSARVEAQIGCELVWESHRFSLRDQALGTTEKLAMPIEKAEFDTLFVSRSPKAEAARAGAVDESLIDISQFAAVDLRVGTILEAEKVKNSDKLVRLVVEAGKEKRQIVAGIARHYTPEQLAGRQIVFVANLKPAKLMGLTSEGMVLAAQKGKKLVLLCPESPIHSGARIS